MDHEGDEGEDDDEDAMMDYEQMDMRICGDLSKLSSFLIIF